ncbi:hypothetical protein [uncultured Jatrophihabitans sp.]|uniref:hypothetical protein n=1 Tax=uncultured Jatrophihabitans sp. TaxID=1610747 RepID=UPI0035C9C0FC
MTRPPAPGRIVQTGPPGRVGPVRCHDTSTGADIVSAGRAELAYELGGRSARIFVEYGVHETVIVYGVSDTWDDGSALTPDQRRDLAETLQLVADFRHWRLDVVYDLVTGEKR